MKTNTKLGRPKSKKLDVEKVRSLMDRKRITAKLLKGPNPYPSMKTIQRGLNGDCIADVTINHFAKILNADPNEIILTDETQNGASKEINENVITSEITSVKDLTKLLENREIYPDSNIEPEKIKTDLINTLLNSCRDYQSLEENVGGNRIDVFNRNNSLEADINKNIKELKACNIKLCCYAYDDILKIKMFCEEEVDERYYFKVDIKNILLMYFTESTTSYKINTTYQNDNEIYQEIEKHISYYEGRGYGYGKPRDGSPPLVGKVRTIDKSIYGIESQLFDVGHDPAEDENLFEEAQNNFYSEVGPHYISVPVDRKERFSEFNKRGLSWN